MARQIGLQLVSIAAACALLMSCAREEPDLRRTVAAHRSVLEELPRQFYQPGLGDLMQALQVRHAKLWFAGTHDNWPLADFELHELEENLERVARWHKYHDDQALAPAIKAYMQAGSYALKQSIERSDQQQFRTAFDRFTDGCNACHKAARHPFIVIQRPTTEPFTNQRWSPASDERAMSGW